MSVSAQESYIENLTLSVTVLGLMVWQVTEFLDDSVQRSYE